MMPVLRRGCSPFRVAGPVALAATLAVVAARGLGMLESAELLAYDAYLRWRQADTSSDRRIALVTITERDVLARGWPLPDAVLARALRTLVRHGPRAIGLDLYRDVPVGAGKDDLDALLRDEPSVIGLMKIGSDGSSGVRPPPVLSASERVGFSDILVDPGGIVRRGLLFLDDGATTSYAFSLRLALAYLKAQGVVPRPDPDHPEYLRLGNVTIPPLEADAGGYVGADARGYQFLLDYKGARRGFDQIDLGSLLAGRFDPEFVRGRIVLIGVVAESVQDNFHTPLSRGADAGRHTRGVLIHAHAASQLLRMGLDGEKPIALLEEWQEWLWILLWALGGALVGARLRSPWLYALTVAGGLTVQGGSIYAAFVAGCWLPVVPPAIAWPGAAVATTAYLRSREWIERTQLMQLFSRHVSPEIADEIWSQRDKFLDGDRPRPQSMTVTALFTDLSGFTTVAERTTPEALFEWLNEYMGAMVAEVNRHRGVIRQFAGDAIVAVFGVPVPRRSEAEIDQDACNAVACALAMEQALRELNRSWRARSRPTTGMRVGILTGAVTCGTLGGAQHSEYVVVGDTVNTASRLESFDKTLFAPDADANPIRILIGEPTRARLGDAFVTERVGEVSLKGKSQAVAIHRVIGRSADAATR
jgi:adenylate cyclase